MLTYYIYTHFLVAPDSFWTGMNIASLWGLGIFLDLLLVFVAVVFVLSAMCLIESQREAAVEKLAKIASALDVLDNNIVRAGCITLSVLVMITFFSVIGRTFGQSIPDDISFAEWTMVLLICLMLGTLQGRGEHIEVTAFSDGLPARGKLILRLLGVAIGFVVITRLAMVSLPKIPDNFLEITYGSIYDLPAWPPRLIFMIGVSFWGARIAVQLLLLPVVLKDRDDSGVRINGRWVLTPLLPEESGHEIEDSGEFAVLPTGGEKNRGA